MSCPRHPLAAAHAGHCAACLIEGAFFEPEAPEGGRRREFTILIPLGGSPGSTVFLVREQAARGRLMRVKTWDRPVPPGFLTEFERLRTRLDVCRGGSVEVPEAAAVDAGGRAFVLSVFRRGTPIVGQVRTGRLDAGRAAGFLRALAASTGQAHAAGLVHGAIGPGNVMSDGRSAFLLDFGLRAIVSPPDAVRASASGDLEGFAALERSVRDAVSPGVTFQAV
jgi:hypothetical protein